jgi:hypothetical protein
VHIFTTWRNTKHLFILVGRYSSVGVATHYGLKGPGSNPDRGRDFPHRSNPALGPTQPLIHWVPDLSRGKAAGAGRSTPSASSTEVKERVGLYFYFPSGPSWPVIGRTLLLASHFLQTLYVFNIWCIRKKKVISCTVITNWS